MNAETNTEETLHETYDFEQLLLEAQPADVILFEGRAPISEVIKRITLSPWTHVALYIGSLHDVKDSASRKTIKQSNNQTIKQSNNQTIKQSNNQTILPRRPF